MFLSKVKIWNFRKYGIEGSDFKTSNPGIVVNFHKGVNVLIGENDSGKTAIVDAIRYVLRTQSGEVISIDEKDFHVPEGQNRTSSMKIECIFTDLSDVESASFWEWLTYEEGSFSLKVRLIANRKDNYINVNTFAGSSDLDMSSEAKRLLRIVYLKPLRDALTDMTHGRKSRLAQILGAHEIFKNVDGVHQLSDEYNSLKQKVEEYFTPSKGGEIIVKEINDILSNFLIANDTRKAYIKLTSGELLDILRQLDLILEENKSGLGSLNLLCMATELLLLSNQNRGLRLAVIEELEAHLHPQYQMRIIDYVCNKCDKEQFILTTHSISLASKISVENFILVKNNKVFPMSREYTKMTASDYKFLNRFLDATKANMFFAKGLIIVEGDAENLLIPAIADIIERPLHRYGVSIVNVGSTAYKRYLSVFDRKDDQDLGMRIAVVSDLDVRSLEYYNDHPDKKQYWHLSDFISDLQSVTDEIDFTQLQDDFYTKEDFENCVKELIDDVAFRGRKGFIMKALREKLTKDNRRNVVVVHDAVSIGRERIERTSSLHSSIDRGCVKLFLPQKWTLEYDIACSGLWRLLAIAVKLADKERSNSSFQLNDFVLDCVIKELNADFPESFELTDNVSYEIFKPLNDGIVSKAMTAQYFASLLQGSFKVFENVPIRQFLEFDPCLKYIVDAIKYVTD